MYMGRKMKKTTRAQIHHNGGLCVIGSLLVLAALAIPTVSAMELYPVIDMSHMSLTTEFWNDPDILSLAAIIIVIGGILTTGISVAILRLRKSRRRKFKRRNVSHHAPKYKPPRHKKHSFSTKPFSIRQNSSPNKGGRIRRGHTQNPIGIPTNQFFECPDCHNPDIVTSQPNFVICNECGFRYDLKSKKRLR